LGARRNFLTIVLSTLNESDGNMGKTISQLPKETKICLTCGRPFTWRKKWKANWDEVKYCSDRCRMHRPTTRNP